MNTTNSGWPPTSPCVREQRQHRGGPGPQVDEGLLFEKRALEHVRAVVVQVGVLLPGELADSHAGVNAPGVEQLVSDFRNDDQFLTSGKRDVALIEEVVDVW